MFLPRGFNEAEMERRDVLDRISLLEIRQGIWERHLALVRSLVATTVGLAGMALWKQIFWLWVFGTGVTLFLIDMVKLLWRVHTTRSRRIATMSLYSRVHSGGVRLHLHTGQFGSKGRN